MDVRYGGEICSRSDGRRMVLAIQKKALLACVKGYSTVSVAAYQVLTGSLPWDLEIEMRIGIFRAKRGLSIPQISDVDRELLTSSAVRKRVLEYAIEKWQSRWDTGEAGRITQRFIPKVDELSKLKIMSLSYRMFAVLTGHGETNAYLKQYGHRNDGGCDCGSESEYVLHLVLSCECYIDLRLMLGRALGIVIDEDTPLTALVKSREIFGQFAQYVETIFRIKQEAEKEEAEEEA